MCRSVWRVCLARILASRRGDTARIGSTSLYHFHGWFAAARQLARTRHGEGTNIALTVPVWPLCTRAVCALAHYLESEGIATIVIGLTSKHVVAMRPPWVFVIAVIPLPMSVNSTLIRS